VISAARVGEHSALEWCACRKVGIEYQMTRHALTRLTGSPSARPLVGSARRPKRITGLPMSLAGRSAHRGGGPQTRPSRGLLGDPWPPRAALVILSCIGFGTPFGANAHQCLRGIHRAPRLRTWRFWRRAVRAGLGHVRQRRRGCLVFWRQLLTGKRTTATQTVSSRWATSRPPRCKTSGTPSYVNAGHCCKFPRELPAGPAVVQPVNGSVCAGGRRIF
jgi:hypothetical protein